MSEECPYEREEKEEKEKKELKSVFNEFKKFIFEQNKADLLEIDADWSEVKFQILQRQYSYLSTNEAIEYTHSLKSDIRNNLEKLQEKREHITKGATFAQMLLRYDQLSGYWKSYIKGYIGVGDDKIPDDETFFFICGAFEKEQDDKAVNKFKEALEYVELTNKLTNNKN